MPLRFTLRQLEYFVAVGEAGSIAKAAEQVNVSPPSISASIAQLEAEFGVQLFVRKHSHALALTAGGRLFLKEAARLLNDADALH
ncbi:LysR family transcriptional regulator, partial [Mesorhizobium sp. M00.F.Ca.ET.149.01.1.1]